MMEPDDIDWESLSQKDIDYYLSPAKCSNRHGPDHMLKHFTDTVTKGSDATRRCTVHESNIPYGDETKKQKLDLYLPEHQTEDAPVLVFFHGGYWKAFSKEVHGLVAMHPVKKGAVVAIVGYTISPEGTLEQMLKEVEQAFVFIARKFPKSRGFYLCGHSAGGQLGAMMLTIDWSSKYGFPKDLIKGCFFMAGVFDLRPISQSCVNEPLKLTREEAYRVSPITPENLSKAIQLSSHCRVVNVCGGCDAKFFGLWTRDYTKKLAQNGVNATYELFPEMDHFEPVERLVEEDFIITKMLLDVMAL
ncbi:kynurenine formamidase-like [Asterias amurensis]|uniref:kynurenine formamidase-like n=1 Tax=Asterias amurensis TaxID=7602 RepID=UPI003AB4B669